MNYQIVVFNSLNAKIISPVIFIFKSVIAITKTFPDLFVIKKIDGWIETCSLFSWQLISKSLGNLQGKPGKLFDLKEIRKKNHQIPSKCN